MLHLYQEVLSLSGPFMFNHSLIYKQWDKKKIPGIANPLRQKVSQKLPGAPMCGEQEDIA